MRLSVFFFQAEDGIRDRSPSRGLGDVYKRQDDVFPWAREGEDPLETKYVYTVHSELNAILNYRGGSLEGAKLYVSLFPCNECAKAIIQSGIKEVIYDSNKYEGTAAVMASMKMFDSAGVNYHKYHRTEREIKISL